MKAFWDAHSSEMRKARLLAAAAIIFSQHAGREMYDGEDASRFAVDMAFKLETKISKRLKEKEWAQS